MVVVCVYVIKEARDVDWNGVLEASQAYGAQALVVALLLSIPSQLSNACLDLIGRHATGHRIPIHRVMLISYTGYFYSLNLGALVGGLAFRYSLYAPYRLTALQISQIILLSVLTNWSGYMLIGGAVLAYQPPELPAEWSPGTPVLRGLGILLLGTAIAYLMLCTFRGGTRVRWRDNDFRLPSLGIATIQVGLSITNWAGMGIVLTWLMPEPVGWLEVMPALMASAIAGIWSHVPGGLGVTEAVFATMLSHRTAESEILAAVLIFRVMYYLIPFVLSTVCYVYLQFSARSSTR
jgi:uncharacterized membrane protein YbhN (UPF0104 family)